MNGEDDIGYQVELYVYDLSRGIAKTMSPTLLGKQIEGIWHTGVVAYGREYFFGSGGIESCRPGGTILGDPDRVEELGESQVPYQLFLEYIFGLGEATYKPGAYDLLKHNCNNFSDEVSQFLCGHGIPKHILQLPDEVLNTPLGETLSTLVKELDIKSTGSRKINFANYHNNNLHTVVAGRPHLDDSPDLELERLNQAIDQVRQQTQRLEDRRNSINEKVNRREKKKKEKREKKEKKEKKKKRKSHTSCDAAEGDTGGGGGTADHTSPSPSCSRTPLPPSPLPTSPQEGEEESHNPHPKPPLAPQQGPGGQCLPPPHPSPPELSVTPAEEEEEGGGEGGGGEGGGGGGQEETHPEEEDSPAQQPITSQDSTPQQPVTEQNTASSQPIDEDTDSQPIGNEDTDPQPSSTDHQPTTEQNTDPQEPIAEEETETRPPLENMADQERLAEDMEAAESEGEPGVVEGEVTRPSPPLPTSTSEPEVEREPPIVFKEDLDAREEFEHLAAACGSLLTPEEETHLEELRAYVLDDEGSWALGENFSVLLGRVLHDGTVPDEARVHLVRVMAAAALKDDVILLLHQDRRDHTIMNYANKVESLGPHHQEALALFFCNMFEHVSPSEWLLYISEWQDGTQATSNIRVTTKVAVNALLNTNPKCQEYGSAIMYNLGTKEVKTVVFDDVAPELAMAILQYFNCHPPEELLWRTMAALCRFTYSSTEVPALIKMIGPEPSTFRGASERVDALIEEIDAKLSRVRLF